MKSTFFPFALTVLLVLPSFAQDNPASTAIQKSLQTSPAAHVGSSPFNPPTATDTNFVVDTGQSGLDTGCTYRSGGPLRFTIAVDRVVGDVNADGTLVSPQTLIANGVVSQFATLRMPAFDVDFDAVLTPPGQPERDRVLLNGTDLGPQGTVAFLTGSNNIWKLNEFQIPIEKIRFGGRNPGSSPTPGQNQIEIQIDTANAAIGRENWCTAIDWSQLSFGALAPVVMIHGNNSSGAFWAGTIAPGTTLPAPFIQPFQQQKIPFDNSITMATASIVNHSALLATLIPGIASEFGAKHVHLVAHSKGGLDSRDFLARTIPANFGVLSLTTLSTPHHGSVGPDYQIDSVNANSLYSDDTTRTKLGQQTPPDAGTFNLRVSFVAGFNAANLPLLPKQFTVDGETSPVVYMSISADANLDNSSDSGGPTIFFNETTGIPGQGSFMPDRTWATVLEQVYRLIGNVASTSLVSVPILGGLSTTLAVRETPTATFQLNDFAVTVTSARMTGFRELASVKNNHATVANPTNAQTVINAIRAVQPVR